MSYRPLPKYLTIKESPIEGLGLFVTEDILHSDSNSFAIVNTHLKFKTSDKCTQLERLPAGSVINHSNNPNVTVKATRIPYDTDYQGWSYYGIFTLRDIKAGEEILLNYKKELCGLDTYKNEEWLK